MGETTGIAWTEKTWNPWHGCRKISPGCKNCYMFSDKARYGQDPTNVVRSKTTFNEPLKWKEPALVFTCSWSDFFIEEADPWRPDAWAIIEKTRHLTYQILTKRPERIPLPERGDEPHDNVWLGVSVEDRKYGLPRIDILRTIPAKVRFLSIEPQLEDLGDLDLTGIGWVIVGGESGHNARPFMTNWARKIIAQCAEQKVPAFVKQLGANVESESLRIVYDVPLKDKKGGNPLEWSEDLRVRQFPEVTSNARS